jgi:hypothetical protein
MPQVSDLDELLAEKRSLDARATGSQEFAARLSALRAWQADRLARTYEDLRRDPRYSSAVEFFLSDLYGPREFTRRDQDLNRAWHYLKRTLPDAALTALGRALELQVLSAELDLSMVATVPAWPLTDTGYATAYRAVDRRDARERQLDLVVGVGEHLDRVVRHAWIGAVLRLARAPVQAAGFGVLQDFLERGFAAFSTITDARPFLRAIRERETRLMQAIFSPPA